MEDLRVSEQSKMDNIIITCSIGLIGVSFGFIAFILEKNPKFLPLFEISLLSTISSVVINYYSSWFSVKDIEESNDILDKRYQNGKDISIDIETKYSDKVDKCNNLALLFLMLGAFTFLIFTYINIEEKFMNKNVYDIKNIIVNFNHQDSQFKTKKIDEGVKKGKPPLKG